MSITCIIKNQKKIHFPALLQKSVSVIHTVPVDPGSFNRQSGVTPPSGLTLERSPLMVIPPSAAMMAPLR